MQRRNFGQTMTRKPDGSMESKAQFFVTGNVSLATLTVYLQTSRRQLERYFASCPIPKAAQQVGNGCKTGEDVVAR